MKNRLGKRLEDLIPKGTSEIIDLHITDIIPSPWQPRRKFDQIKLEEMAASIKTNGLIQPIVVRHKGTKYEIIAGERRLRAAKVAGLEKISALVVNIPDDILPEVSLIENIQREDLTALEMAESLKKILDFRKDLTQEELAERIGMSRSQVTNYLRLNSLPEEVKNLIQEGKISFGHARALLSLPEDEQIIFAHKIFERELSVRDTEKLVKLFHSQPKEKNTLKKEIRDDILEGYLRDRYFPHARVFLRKDGLYIKVSQSESSKLIEFIKEVFLKYVNSI